MITTQYNNDIKATRNILSYFEILTLSRYYRNGHIVGATGCPVPKRGMSVMMMAKTSPMLAPAHVPGIMVVTDIDLHGDAVDDL